MIELGLPGARVVFTTRRGGVSEGPYDSLNLGALTDDDPERVSRNRELLSRALGLDPGNVAMGWQVHGGEIEEWAGPPPPGRDGFRSPGSELSRVDGHATRSAGLGLLVLVADCLPVALASPGRVAMLHCGWRGLAAGILERGVETFDEPPAAAVGPGIGRCCYQVGPEVLDAFSGLEGVAKDGMLDLRAVAEAKLRAAGVTRVEHVDMCTSCRADLFFSHRRDVGVTGRQAGIVERTA
ncbi:MAG: polyphenol oxidase family protein [Actinobacteria bacterium]|nr:polyphenol oxidase family protein [Actinomycetota bacterium]